MNAEIISIGTELLMGETVDTNSSYLAGELAKIGVDLVWRRKSATIPDASKRRCGARGSGRT